MLGFLGCSGFMYSVRVREFRDPAHLFRDVDDVHARHSGEGGPHRKRDGAACAGAIGLGGEGRGLGFGG